MIKIQAKEEKTVSDIKIPKPTIMIDKMALEKIRFFVDKDNEECSGMGMTRVVGDTIYIDDIKMLKQKNGAAHTDIDADAVNKLNYEWRERQGEMNFWWHSHVNMSTFWSGTDEATIRQLGQHGMCVAAVFNKKREVRCAVAVKMQLPFMSNPDIIMFDNVEMRVGCEIPDEVKAAWSQEHEENVVKRTWSSHGYNGYRESWRQDHEKKDKVFRPVKTVDQFHWDWDQQGRDNDPDWNGTNWNSTIQKWRKSDKYLEAEKEYYLKIDRAMEEMADKQLAIRVPSIPASPSTLADADQRMKRAFAHQRDEIVGYDSILDMFELPSGVKVNADWYMLDVADKEGYHVFDYSEAREATQEEIDILGDLENKKPKNYEEQEEMWENYHERLSH